MQLTHAKRLSIEKALRLETDAMAPAFIEPDTAGRVAQFKG